MMNPCEACLNAPICKVAENIEQTVENINKIKTEDFISFSINCDYRRTNDIRIKKSIDIM